MKAIHRILFALPMLICVLLFSALPGEAQQRPAPTRPTAPVVDETIRIPTDDWGVILAEGSDPNAVAAQLGFINLGGVANLPDTYLFRRPDSAANQAITDSAAASLRNSPSVVYYEQQIAVQYETRQDAAPESPARAVTGSFNAFTTLNGTIDALVVGRGLRGTGTGNIFVTGIPDGATISAAYMYWAVHGTSGDTTATLNGNAVTGTLIGTGGDTCLGGGGVNRSYRATVTSLVSGNGLYTVAGLPNGNPPSQSTQGASLVIVYSLATLPNRTIMIRDGAITLNANNDATTDTFTGFTASSPVLSAKLSMIVGDGNNTSDGTQLVNGQALATNPFYGADGSAWDSQTYDISGYYTAAPLNSLTVTFRTGAASADCLLWTAGVLSVVNSTFVAPSNPVADPLFRFQWHLRNNGQTGGLPGADANVVPVWNAGYNGTGVTVAVVDDGLERTHPDLSANYNATGSFDFNGGDSDPMPGPGDTHGTSVAGVVGARDNSTCGVGAAYRAGLSGIRLIAAPITDAQIASALTYQPNVNHIYSNSWGPNDNGATLGGPGALTLTALQNGVNTGRGGLGSIYVFAAGNGYQNYDNMNADGYANNRFVIAVGAIDHNGKETWYGEPGAAILVSAPSNSLLNWQNLAFFPPAELDYGITTTDLTGTAGYGGYYGNDCTSHFGGTSSAAPLVSGVIALMLDANPNLGWRDVQHILVDTAVKNDPTDAEWVQNGDGRWVNHQFGFGRVNAQAAVNAALTWQNVPSQQTFTSPVTAVNTAIPDNNVTGISRTINMSIPNDFVVERVEVIFNALHTWRGDLVLELIRPGGATSVLMSERPNDSNDNYSNWRFATVRNWGEGANGNWTLRVSDRQAGDVGTWQSWQLVIHGYTPGALTFPAPTLLSPANGAQVGLTPLLKWTSVDGADRYWGEIDNNSDFSSPEASFQFVTDWSQPRLKLGDPLTNGVTYYWRVRAGTEGNPGVWSTARSFTALNTAEAVGIGIYNPANALWLLRNQLTTGDPTSVFLYGGIAGGLPVVGDWDGDGVDTAGIYVPDLAYWFMRNSNTTGIGEIFAVFGGIAGGLPVVGDWDGDGIDTMGLYVPSTGTWYLRNSNTTGEPDIVFSFGGIPGALPIAGDWNGSGTDYVGLYVPSTALWILHQGNVTTPFNPDVTLVYGGIAGGLPIVGDWDGNGTDTVGIYVPDLAYWFMRNTNTTGTGDIFMVFGGISGALPIVGDWTLGAAPFSPPRGDDHAEATEEPEATVEVTEESTEEATDAPTSTPFPTLGIPVEPTFTYIPPTDVEPTLEPTPTPIPLIPPVYATMDDGAADWIGTNGWGLLAVEDQSFWSMSGTSAETLVWTSQLDLRGVLSTENAIKLYTQTRYLGDGVASVHVTTDGITSTVVATILSGEDWQLHEVDLSAYAGQIIQIAYTWVETNADTTDSWLIDSVVLVVEPLPTDTPTDAPTLEAPTAEATTEATIEASE